MSKLAFYLERKLAALLLRALRASIRFEVVNQPSTEQEPVIYAFWHRNLMYCTLQRAGDPAVVMISSSKDGELIAGPVEELGFIPVRGSSTRQGSEALKGMLRWARTNPLAITPDGPKGPVGTIHPGLWQIAILARIPIVGVACDASREWTFNSWDRFRFPKPFAKVRIRYSEPISLESKADIPAAEEQLRKFLKEYDKLF
ncbi:MAG TPA: lysophospholipid acyltransferase family protein [Candidatus Cloacimonadota bacterium]|nr:lysophospholipid acyltransferase family protein [Candidatus Cloacimonadota bacterium]